MAAPEAGLALSPGTSEGEEETILYDFPAPFLLPDGLVRLVNKQINWHLVLASNGKLLAAVQDQCVEI
ncbi:Hypothetical predicted protein, partial [Marmota monax]